MSEVQELERDQPLLRIAGAISDAEAVDWEAEKRRNPGLSKSLERLRLVESLVRAATAPLELEPRRTPSAAAPRGEMDDTLPVLRSWGPLRVLEKIGEGGFADVYRAHDPTLDCDVALKLWRADTGEAQEKLLEEARRLARVRHDNVLVVHGADRFEGRAGMWTDLVHGETLEQRLWHHGRFGAREAAAIGIELCRALAAMHAAGLVHRDVKTSNVMRTEQGRYVLMDFGCVGELARAGELEQSATLRGTPMTMAPEQLLGGSIGPAADLYGLGVLLYRLVTEAYPIEATSYLELVDRHRAGKSVPLLDRRPDLPASFVHVVETALNPDPQQRFPSAGTMEHALHKVTLEAENGEEPPPEPVRAVPQFPTREPLPLPLPRPWWRRGRVQVAVAAGFVALVATPFIYDSVQKWRAEPHQGTVKATAGAPLPGAGGTESPVATAFEVRTTLFRVTPSGDERLTPGALVSPGDELSLEIEGSVAMYVYVFNEDARGHAYALFPVPGFDQGNPLAPRVHHRLPGTIGGVTASWQINSAGGRERVLVIASRDALPDLEREIARFPRPSKGAPVSYGELSAPLAARLRGMGGLVTGPPAAGASVKSQLGPIAEKFGGAPKNARDPWVWLIELENPVR